MSEILLSSYWHLGEPNNFEGKIEECVELKFQHEENSWNDQVCGDENFWICEKKVALWVLSELPASPK